MNKDQEAAVSAAADNVLAGRNSAVSMVTGYEHLSRLHTLEVNPNNASPAKPEIADKPSFFKDVLNGVVGVAKTIWHVPAAQGAIATLVVRAGLPATVVAVLVPIIDALVK